MIFHPQEAKYGKMLTTDNLTGVDPAPGAGPDPGHGRGMVSMAEKIKFMCLTSVRVMGSVVCLDHSSCLTLLDQHVNEK